MLEPHQEITQNLDEAARENYQTIAKRLDDNIKGVKKVVDLVEELRTTQRLSATKEEHLLLKWPQTNALSAEEIALILEAKSISSEKRGKNYQPVLIDTDENFEKLKNIVEENIKNKVPFHYDIIIKKVHCTPLQMNFDGVNLRNFYIDAAGSRQSSDRIVHTFNKKQAEDIFGFYSPRTANQRLQSDNVSCSIYSIQDLNTNV